MKIFLTFALLFFINKVSAFSINLNCQFNAITGNCAAFNTWNYPIYCSLRANGLLLSGITISAWNNATIFPGQYAYVYLNTNNPNIDPLVDVQGYANCKF